MYIACIISETVNIMDFPPIIRLYYIGQLILRKRDYPGWVRPNHVKGTGLFLKSEIQHISEIWQGSPLLNLQIKGAMWQGILAISRSEEQLPDDSQQSNRHCSLTTTMNWIQPTTSINMETDFLPNKNNVGQYFALALQNPEQRTQSFHIWISGLQNCG